MSGYSKEYTPDQLNELAEVLRKNPTNLWTGLLVDFFEGADPELVSFMVQGYLDLGTTKMTKILDDIKDENLKNRINNFGYNDYSKVSTIQPTEEDRLLAEQALEKAKQHEEELREKMLNQYSEFPQAVLNDSSLGAIE